MTKSVIDCVQVTDSYITLAKECCGEILVRNSRFKSFASPVSTESNAEQYIKKLKNIYYDATHHSYAAAFRNNQGTYARWSDDGEPSGTAGKPILGILKRHRLENIICVVVRYFGGIKLGIGGLARAYADSAENAIHSASTIIKYDTRLFRFSFPYEMIGAVERLLTDSKAEVVSRNFSELQEITCSVRFSLADQLVEQFSNATHGRGTIAVMP